MADLLLEHLTKRHGRVLAVDDLCLHVEDRELLVIVGPSGGGKTTTLRMIAGLEPVTSGHVLIGGQSVDGLAPHRRNVAMVFQGGALYPHLNVFANLAFGLRMQRVPRAEIARRVVDAARRLGIEPLLSRKPGTLSGGERQRVAIGRAMVREPAVFLLDEPLSHLDARLRITLRTELVKLQRDLATTMIVVTHDQAEALAMGHRIAVLHAGRLQQVGTPTEVAERPANPFVAEFLGLNPRAAL